MPTLSAAEQLYFAPHIPRVEGLEREFGISFYEGGVPFYEHRRFPARPILNHIYNTEGTYWAGELGTIGRAYYDLGDHLEFATNEYLDYKRLALAQLGGDLLMVDAVQAQTEHYRETRAHRDVEALLSIRSSDDGGHAYFGGVHVNLSMARSSYSELMNKSHTNGEYAPETKQLATYLMLSSLVMGPGMLRPSQDADKRGSYVLHPFERLHSMTETLSHRTTVERPIVNMRNEPHAPKDTHARLHTIALDALVRPRDVARQVSALSAMLRTFELDKPIPRWLDSPLMSLYSLKRNPEALLRVGEGEKEQCVPAYELALEVFGHLVDLANQEGFPEQEREALQSLFDATYDYVHGDTTSEDVADTMPWVERRRYLESLDLLHRPLSPDEYNMLKSYNRQFDSYGIKPDEVVVGAFMRKVRTERICAAALQEVMTPPTDTRAGARAALIASIPREENLVIKAVWDEVTWHYRGKEYGEDIGYGTKRFYVPHTPHIKPLEKSA